MQDRDTPRINYYSDDTLKYKGYSLGNSSRDNAGVITRRRFLISEARDESIGCKKGNNVNGEKKKRLNCPGCNCLLADVCEDLNPYCINFFCMIFHLANKKAGEAMCRRTCGYCTVS